jgi:lipoprotein-anchoring transpeptidase ErfK/SrfK
LAAAVFGSAVLIGCGAGAKPALSIVRVTATASPDAGSGAGATPSATASAAVGASQTPIAAGPPERVRALAIGSATAVRSAPSMSEGVTVRTLSDRQPLVILREVRGQRWIVADQTWAMALQDWTNLWYEVDGGYVYSGFVFIPRANELEAIGDQSAPHWVDVDLNQQTAMAMVGDRAVHTAAATTGKPGYETPAGEHTIAGWGFVFNETMTSSQAAIQDPNEQYNVKNVLYTEYFDGDGDALHLNYWQPDGVFGRQRTSHGCVGLQLHDAQFFWLFDSAGARVNVHPAPEVTPTPTASATPSPTPGIDLNQRFTRGTLTPTPAHAIPPPPPPPTLPPRAPPSH